MKNGILDINNRIRQFIFTQFPLARQYPVGEDISLLDSGIIDSLGILDLVMFLEKEFNIAVSEEDLLPDNFESIAQLGAFVQSKRSSNATG